MEKHSLVQVRQAGLLRLILGVIVSLFLAVVVIATITGMMAAWVSGTIGSAAAVAGVWFWTRLSRTANPSSHVSRQAKNAHAAAQKQIARIRENAERKMREDSQTRIRAVAGRDDRAHRQQEQEQRENLTVASLQATKTLARAKAAQLLYIMRLFYNRFRDRQIQQQIDLIRRADISESRKCTLIDEQISEDRQEP